MESAFDDRALSIHRDQEKVFVDADCLESASCTKVSDGKIILVHDAQPVR